jgi:glycosyltransferase involved in cell wall biosynthesis
VSALVPYKRLEVAIDACRRLGAPLKIVGTGPEQGRLQGIAGPGVEFLGWRSDEEIRELYRRSTAVLLPGVEDFGMVPVEAQACGCPVVALNAGGTSETVVDGETGVLVEDSTAEAFADGLDRVRRQAFDRERLREHALQFSRARFLAQFQAVVDEAVSERNAREGVDPAASNSQPKQSAAREDVDPAASNSPMRQSAAREDEQ